MSHLVALSLSVLLAAGTPCERTVIEGTTYGLPGPSHSIVTIDADADGRPDIVAAVESVSALSVLMNRSDGFHAISVALPHTSEVVITADVNGDSVNEILAIGPLHLSTLFTNGDGTFRVVSNAFSGAPFNLGLDRYVATGDVTGDGKLDFVGVTARPAATQTLLRVFAGGGDGTFTHRASSELPRSAAMISIGELTGDAKADVLLGDTEEAALLPSNGDGTFGARQVLSRTGRERTVLAMDMDGDGRADMMTFSDVASSRLLFLSSHGYASPQQHDLPGWSRIADFDGDGDLDFISGLRSFRTEASGTHTPVWRGAGSVTAVTSGDYDRDGNLDLAVPSPGWQVIIRRGKGNLEFEGSRVYSHSATISELVTSDLNGDGRADVLAAGGSAITLGFGNTDGSLSPVESLGVLGASTVTAADFNGDGAIDLFTLQGFIPGKIGGPFNVGAAIAAPENLGSIARATPVDINGDGKLDVVALRVISSPPTELATLLGDGTGKFTLSLVPAVHRAITLVIGDVSGDGKPDILTSGAETDGRSTVRLLTGGNSVIVAEGVSDGIRTAKTLAIGDVDGDGKLDFVTPAASKRELLLFHGNGNGTFVLTRRIPIEGPLYVQDFSGIALADLTGDGRLDIMVSNEEFVLFRDEFEQTSILQQLVDGTFAEVARLPYGDIRGATAGDVDGDGFADLLVPGGFSMVVLPSACRTAPLVRLLVEPSSPEHSTVVFSALLDIPEASGTVILVDEDPVSRLARTIGSAPVVAGRATITSNALARGTHRLKAIYSGDGPYTRAISRMVEHLVTDPPPTGPRRRSTRH